MTEPSSPAVPMQEPVCPRHPDRVAYVRCQRCGRPTCPECQRPAAVGVQCVDCVVEAARNTPRPRTQFGVRSTGDRPMVTLGIVAICAVVWLLQQASASTTGELAFAPFIGRSQPWRFLTAAFAHSPSSPLHILFNMFALWSIGGYLEPLIGRARFAALYLISAVGGSVGYLLLVGTPDPATAQQCGAWCTPTVGASGAVFGLFAAMLVLNRHLGRSSAGIAGVLVVNAVLGFVIPNVAWQAHVGGAVTGAVCAAVLAACAAQGRRRWQWPALAGVAVLVVALAVARYAVTDPQLLALVTRL